MSTVEPHLNQPSLAVAAPNPNSLQNRLYRLGLSIVAIIAGGLAAGIIAGIITNETDLLKIIAHDGVKEIGYGLTITAVIATGIFTFKGEKIRPQDIYKYLKQLTMAPSPISISTPNPAPMDLNNEDDVSIVLTNGREEVRLAVALGRDSQIKTEEVVNDLSELSQEMNEYLEKVAMASSSIFTTTHMAAQIDPQSELQEIRNDISELEREANELNRSDYSSSSNQSFNQEDS